MKKSIFFSLFVLFVMLAGCANNTATNSTDSSESFSFGCVVWVPDLFLVSEEELFELSDLVYLVRGGKQGKSVQFDDGFESLYIYTIYYFDVIETYKGDKIIDFAYFIGDSTPNATCMSVEEEKIEEGKIYKLYLRLRDNKYFTTAGFQSIIEMD